MTFETATLAWIRLSGRVGGIEEFRVVGTLDAKRVRARWDGRWLLMSRCLREWVDVALAVQEVFVAGTRLDDLHTAPEDFMLAVISCCDELEVVEYKRGGHRRVITPDGQAFAA